MTVAGVSSPAHAGLVNRLGLWILAILLLSPAVFKVRVMGGLVVHPFVLVLIVAWGWVLYASADTFSRRKRGWYSPEWQTWNTPLILLGLSIAGLALSLGINSIRLGSLQSTGWLLLLKWGLYLAPLPLTALLALRTGFQVVRLVSYLIPAVALLTLLYSCYRMGQALDGRYINAYVDASSTFFAMGMFAEVLSPEGLVVRSDTGSHGAYGMYLAFASLFSLCLALFQGWHGVVNRGYAVLQGLTLAPLCFMGILWTGSRSSLVLLLGAILMLALLALINPGGLLARSRRLAFAGLLFLMPLGLLGLTHVLGVKVPTLDRVRDTLTASMQLEQTVRGELSPVDERHASSQRAVQNVQTRVWLWGQSFRYLLRHPFTMVTGIGYDRRRFVEEVVGIPFEGFNFSYQTAHNLYLDVLIKGGIGPLLPLVAACVWVLWVGIKSVTIPAREPSAVVRIGVGWIALACWPPLLLVSLTCEELLTDNLMLHWTALFGLLLGLCGTALAEWLPNRIVHMTATAGVGGGPAYLTALADHQLGSGIQVRVFCSDEKPYVEIWRRMPLDLSVLPMRRPNARSVWQLLKELLRAPAPIHAHGRGAAFFAIWVKILVRVPVIYTPHGPHYADNRGWRYLSGWLFELCCRLLLDAIVYVSPGERETARRHRLPTSNSRVVLSGLVQENAQSIHSGDMGKRLRAELTIPDGRFLIGWIGRFHRQKGLDILLESVRIVSTQVPEATWAVIGEGSEEDRRRYRSILDTLPQRDRVLFLGGRPDAFALMRDFDLFVSTSRWEGLPLVLLEAMEQGIPIVASDVIGNRDVLQGWGMLFNANDPKAAGEAQIRLALDAPLRARLAKLGREVRRSRFALSRMLREMDQAYYEILGASIFPNGQISGPSVATQADASTRWSAGVSFPG